VSRFYTPDEILAVRQRAADAIERVDRMVEEQRLQRLGLAGNDTVPQRRAWPPPPVEDLRQHQAPAAAVDHPVHRPVGTVRDWHSERLWIESFIVPLIEQRIEQRLSELVEAIGDVIAQERKAYRKALDKLLDEERTELRRRFDERLERLDRLLGTFARTELHAWPTTAAPTN
jgi:hypothetical protein